MSPASRAVKRLRELYSFVFRRMRQNETRLANPLAGCVYFPGIEQLEPRLLLSGTSYALLFSGGGDSLNNYDRYYDTTKLTYQALIDDCGLSPDNVFVLFADGTDPGLDQNRNTYADPDLANSDMSFATDNGSIVESATPANLLSRITALQSIITTDDSFLFWSYDHGSGFTPDDLPGAETVRGEEKLVGWGGNISDIDLTSWLSNIIAATSTYVFSQCFSGGMLDNFLDNGTDGSMPEGTFGMASANHYEYGLSSGPWWFIPGSGFAWEFKEALEAGYRYTQDIYQYAYQHTASATDGEGPAGTFTSGVQHPWSRGENFGIFGSLDDDLADDDTASIKGLIGDNQPYRTYEFTGHAGDLLTIELTGGDLIDSFDSALAIFGPDQDSIFITSEADTDLFLRYSYERNNPLWPNSDNPAIIQLVLTQDGTYTIQAQSDPAATGDAAAGPFELSITLDQTGPLEQQFYLDFSAFETSDVTDYFDYLSGNPTTLQQTIINSAYSRFQSIFEPYNIGAFLWAPDGQYSTLRFVDNVNPVYSDALGIADQIDYGNKDRSDGAQIFFDHFGLNDYEFSSAEDIGIAMGTVAAHEAGHILGLRHVDALQPLEDIMGQLGGYTWLLQNANFGEYDLYEDQNTLFGIDIDNGFDIFGKQDSRRILLNTIGQGLGLRVTGYSPEGPINYSTDRVTISFNDAVDARDVQQGDIRALAMAPEPLDTYAIDYSYDFKIRDGYAYVAKKGGVEIVDISHPDAMAYVSTNGSTVAYGVDIEDDTLVLAQSSTSVAYYDISNPAYADFIYSFTPPGWSYDVALSEGSLYTVGGSTAGNGFLLIGQSVRYTFPSTAVAVEVEDCVAYVVTLYDGLYILDVSDPSSPSELARWSFLSRSGRSVVVSNGLCLVSGSSRLYAFDVTNPSEINLLGSIEISGLQSVSIEGMLAYAATDSSIIVYDLTEPAAFVPLATYEYAADEVLCEGDTLFVLSDGITSLHIAEYPESIMQVSNNTLEVVFTDSFSEGIGGVRVGPRVAGLVMDQDDDGVLGEPEDEYVCSVTIDLTAPPAIEEIFVWPDLGASGDDRITAETTPCVYWSAPSDASGIKEYCFRIDNGSWVQTTNTYFQVTLSEGIHQIAVYAIDRANNLGSESMWEISIDITAPSAPTDLSVDGDMFLWQAPADSSGIWYFEWKVDEGEWIRSDEPFVHASSIPSGIHNLYARAIDIAGNIGEAGSILNIYFPSAIIRNKYAFYNDSYFDGNNASANTSDDAAIDPSKQALLPGGMATFANYTSYSRGINGIMIDIEGLAETPSFSDFIFKVGNSDDPSSWSTATAPTNITVRPDEGESSSDRVTIIWADNAIQKQWLQVTILSDANGGTLGLASDDVFYFGNAIGETGNSGSNAFVDGTDFVGVRDNPHNFLNRALIDDAYDINRDSFVDGTDLVLVRDDSTNFLTALKLISVPDSSTSSGEPIMVLSLASNSLVRSTNPLESEPVPETVQKDETPVITIMPVLASVPILVQNVAPALEHDEAAPVNVASTIPKVAASDKPGITLTLEPTPMEQFPIVDRSLVSIEPTSAKINDSVLLTASQIDLPSYNSLTKYPLPQDFSWFSRRVTDSPGKEGVLKNYLWWNPKKLNLLQEDEEDNLLMFSVKFGT